jgi:hypothetical protein
MSIIGNSIIIPFSPIAPLPEFSYSGTYRYQYDSNNNWELAFLSGNATNLVFKKNTGNIDIFIVGSGANGGKGYSRQGYNYYAVGGKGGNGGEIKTISNIAIRNNVNYPITIGTAGNVTSITIGDTTYSCISGGGKEGQDGAVIYAQAITDPGKNGLNGVYAFGSSTTQLWSGYRYGASGGGGGARNASYYIHRNPGIGGTSGAGGGGAYDKNGGKATANSGSGGGGGGYDQPTGVPYNGGAGGSGIIIIRNHR